METEKENIVQALVITDLFNNNFDPISQNKPMGLIPIAGVPIIDYVLESLSFGGVGETFLFCCQDVSMIKDHIKKRKDEKAPWSVLMDVQIITSDTCQTMGDCMREIDAAGILRGYFILLGVNTITNVNFSALLEHHKSTCKKDKGAAMTLVYKEVSWKHPLIMHDDSTLLAADSNNKVLIHEKYKPKSSETSFVLPLDSILQHSEVKLHHTLIDANIALCSPSVLPLFSDNFDFQTRNDFVHGILINEDILASSLYYTLLKENQYAAAITNWKTYQTVCFDILHNWAYPLSIETGSFYQNSYLCMGHHKFQKINSTLSRTCTLTENVLIGANTHISDLTQVTKSILGSNCDIGSNIILKGSHIMNNVVIKNNCTILNSFIDDHCTIEENSVVEGVIAVPGVCIKANSTLKGTILEETENKNNDKLFIKSTSECGADWENESSGDGLNEFIGFEKEWSDSDSCYSFNSSAESSLPDSPVPEDTNIFLQEVIDSLARGYEDKLKCDCLILEINSSRYAYNIQLHEVNFFVVRAMLSMPILKDNNNVLNTVKDILKYFQPILSNYIKTKPSIMDCLTAIEDSCVKNEWLDGKAGQVIHLFYEMDVVDEDSLLEWYKELQENTSPIVEQRPLVKFFEWLDEASEESEDSD